MKRYILSIFLFFNLYHSSYSQDILSLFSTEGQNAQNTSLELFRRYTQPLSESYAWAISLGWNHTARPHRPIGFDLSIGTSAILLAPEQLYYTVDDLEGVRVISGTNRLPTFFGSNTNTSVIGVKNDDGTEAIIPATQGVNIDFAVLPTIKFGLGVFKNTELLGRLFPKVEYNGIVMRMWGAGIKHNIIQWFFKEKSPFDLSIFGGYTEALGKYPVDQSGVTPVVNPGNLEFETRGGDFEAIISKTFPLLTIYASTGFVYSKNTTTLVGDYRLENNTDQTLNIPDEGVIDVYELKAWKFTGGVMLKFGLVFINGDYTYAESHQFNAGLGLTLK
ncbi:MULTISPECIES: DUF6588 family protein [Flammeovirga]|uniref:Uncharacterized protein n=1 Tax=Flammeovirga agarivorans TaxID=2726742 RepID=A0A7X8SLN6_9BACT|nr:MULTISPECIES: DUF6588 family protein [Flammeovirga]NLR92440.1 hypothetical protein [Flammeovirga agarivorans]